MGINGKLLESNSQMLTVLAEIKNTTLTLLLDSGASNNFLSKNDAVKLGLTLHNNTPSSVKLADGKKLTTKQYVEEMVSFGGIQTLLKFEILECECVPILGYTFLK